MNDIHIKDVDIDKYLDWLFSLSLDEMEESITQHEKETTWNPFTEQGCEAVKRERIKSFNQHLDRFNNLVGGSPLPLFVLAKDEFEGIQQIYEPIFSEICQYILRGVIVYDWYKLGEYCGYIDYLKYLHSLSRNNVESKDKPINSLSRLERMILFYYLVKSNVIINQRISQDNKPQSFIIGLLIGQSVDYSSYQDDNDMRKDWPKIQKELATPKKTNSLATKKRLENVLKALGTIKDFVEIKSMIIRDMKDIC